MVLAVDLSGADLIQRLITNHNWHSNIIISCNVPIGIFDLFCFIFFVFAFERFRDINRIE